jgi:hypothetical protein
MRATISVLAFVVIASSAAGDLHAECHPQPATCDTAPLWREGARYKAGDRVVGVGGNLWECKKKGAKHCDDRGRQPDVDPGAAEVWAFVEQCFIAEGPEVSTTDVFVSNAQCGGATSSITLSAVIVNDSPFGLDIPVAFYHSASKTLIGVVTVPLVGGEGDVETVRADLVWNNPTPGSALITVVADDDGTGHGRFLESNETDNALSVTLQTCP